MNVQSQILGTLRGLDPACLGTALRRGLSAGRIGIARSLCETFGFHDAVGRPQLSGCLKALGVLERSGRIELPASRVPARPPQPRRLETAPAAAAGVPATVSAVEGLSLVRVDTVEQRKLWNTLLHWEHPQGTATFAGCQIRYLVSSRHGILGALGFSAAALQLAARDRWINWSPAQRRAQLHRVVCLSRFLIRPGVSCLNLASHVLGLALRRLPEDFEQRYGYRPWLVETFVGPDQAGTCFRAANFVAVGSTAGRGRQDREKRRAQSEKTVYMYPLEANWRQRLGVAFVDAAPSLQPAEGLDSEQWTRNEFGGAPLGDQRLSARLVKSVDLLASIAAFTVPTTRPPSASGWNSTPCPSRATDPLAVVPSRHCRTSPRRASSIPPSSRPSTISNSVVWTGYAPTARPASPARSPCPSSPPTYTASVS